MYYLCIVNTIPMVCMAGYRHTNGQDVALVEDTHSLVSLLCLCRRALRRTAEIFTEKKVSVKEARMDESSAEVKPKIEQGDDGTLSIKVRDQQNGEVVFKVKRSTRFKRVLDAFCNKKSWDSAQVRFAYEGQRVQEDMTPDDLGMENNDVRVFLFFAA